MVVESKHRRNAEAESTMLIQLRRWYNYLVGVPPTQSTDVPSAQSTNHSNVTVRNSGRDDRTMVIKPKIDKRGKYRATLYNTDGSVLMTTPKGYDSLDELRRLLFQLHRDPAYIAIGDVENG